MTRLRRTLTAFLAAALVAAPASAEESCGDEVQVDRFRYYRQLSLDLRGRVPTEAELQALVELDGVSDAMVREIVEGEEFYTFVRRYHRDLLLPVIENQNLADVALATLLPATFYEPGGNDDRLFILYVGLYERGGLVPCKDEPAEFDEQGDPILEDYGDGTLREGWVLVEPYWAPGTEVKVCALEARMAPFNEAGQGCNRPEGMFSGGCGCGPGLEHCLSGESILIIQQNLQEQLMRMIEKPIRLSQPYFNHLLDNREDLNGPLIHYYRHIAAMAVDPIVQQGAVPSAALPADVPFTDLTWKTYERAPEHSGVLTSLQFLLRFQTARSRANRFFNAYLCAPFQAPSIDLPSPNDPCSDEPNLRERCGCKYCHQALEPAAAHWARFAEAGSMYLDPYLFPEFRPQCAECASDPTMQCDFFCNRFYLTEAGHEKEEPFVGQLKNLVFREGKELDNVEGGPRKLVEDQLQGGALARCTVRKLFERFYRRPMSDVEAADMLPRLTRAFEDGGYDFKQLVTALVTDATYRRMVR